MYSIYSDGVCIHEDVYALPQYKVLGAKLILEENSPGSLPSPSRREALPKRR